MSARYAGRDGVELSYRQLGAGRPAVLLHGFMGNTAQWIDHGIADALADAGHRVIMADMRGHGESARPHEAAAYPTDVLADDTLALIDALGLDDYDLVGYSLGGKIALRALARGARPARAVIGGQGLDALDASSSRTGGYRALLDAIIAGQEFEPGSQQALSAEWLHKQGNDPVALRFVLGCLAATTDAELAAIDVPTLVLIGTEDHTHASADQLAQAIPNARLTRIPGDHVSVMIGPELPQALVDFLHRD